MNDFLDRLKQRKLVQWALAYVAAAFALIQVLDIVAQRFGWPEQTVRFSIIALAIGFFITLVLAWYHGERGAQRVNGTELSILALLLAIAGVLLWHFAPGVDTPARNAAAASSTTSPVGSAVTLPVERKLPAENKPTTDSKSIAVLPFENLSDDKANGYFAVGIQDEILTRLAKIGALKVVSRTSTEQFAGHTGNLSEIAVKLGVANIVEGTVQKAADSVHINVQLIRAASDEHLWAETYDRKLDNIFGVEGEVAGAIANALKAQLSGAERSALASKLTLNAEAYDFYLRGLSEYRRSVGVEALLAASTDFAEAVKRDPNFMQAWAYGSTTDGLIYFQAIDHSTARLEAARRGAERAMQLAPESFEAWLARGEFFYRTLDFDAARAALGEALKREPNNAEVLSSLAYVERRDGHYQQAIEGLQKVVQIDPGNSRDLSGLAETLTLVGRPAEARPWVEKALALRPDDASTIVLQALTYLYEGNLDAASRLLDPLPLQLADYYALSPQVQLRDYQRDYSGGASALQAALSAPEFTLNGLTAAYYPQLAWHQRWASDEHAAQATFKQGRDKLRALRERWGDNGYIAANLGLIEAGLGDAGAAEREARLGVERVGKDQFNRSSQLVILAQALALSDRHDAAFVVLHDLVANPNGLSAADLRLSPFWDTLRDDPRFAALQAQAQAVDQAKAQGTYRP